ncbi:MAG: tyrosine-type recombinase/integrase [Deltaproteobacteria bacterium]|nr:tyrosine-type recombinase/integrase [Deltaproteobacteria bacterium]
MKGRKVRLTDASIGKLKSATTEYAVWDSEVPGLGVRVRPSGHRSFVWHGRVQGEPVRATVGPAALMTVEDARKRALALRLGTAPHNAEGRSGAPLFRDFVLDEWWPAYRRRCAPSSCRFANRVLERQLIPTLGHLPLDAIRRIDVERWFDAYSRTAPGGANKALEILSQIMNAALAAGHTGTAPVKGITKNPRPKLTRFLSAEEIERLHRVLDRLVDEWPSRAQQADIVRLLLLTGCRKGEIMKLRWSEVDGDRLNLAHTKTGPRRVWLSKAAQAILARQPRAAGPYVFPSPMRPDKPLSDALHFWHRARKEAELDDVRLHDLRHTVASQAVARGVPLSTVARMLGHADPKMTLRYAHVGDRDLQAAAERIGTKIEAVMAGV